MIANVPPTHRDRAASAPAFRVDLAHPAACGPRSWSSRADIAGMIPRESAVLWLGPAEVGIAREMEARSCRVVVLPTADQDREEPIDVRPDIADLDRVELGRGRFDAVYAADVLGRVRRPDVLLDAIRVSLRSGGRLVASVPNAAHAAVREALARGGDPYGSGGPLDAGHVRLFTRESLILAIEEAGFALGCLRAFDPSEAGDPSVWLAVALPLPVAGLDVVQAQFREVADGRFEAEQAAGELRVLLAKTREALDAAHRRAEHLMARERETHAEWIEAQQALFLRDEEHRATTRDLLGQLEELEPLRRERDAAHRQALAAEARCRALELRIEHVLMEFPRRVLRKVRSLARRRP